MPNPETGKHKGFGFIEFEDPSAAQRALMNQIVIAGRQVRYCSQYHINIDNNHHTIMNYTQFSLTYMRR